MGVAEEKEEGEEEGDDTRSRRRRRRGRRRRRRRRRLNVSRVLVLKTPPAWQTPHGVPHAPQTAAWPQWPAHARQDPAATPLLQLSQWSAMGGCVGSSADDARVERRSRRRKWRMGWESKTIKTTGYTVVI